jgi:hypothetical protein
MSRIERRPEPETEHPTWPAEKLDAVDVQVAPNGLRNSAKNNEILSRKEDPARELLKESQSQIGDVVSSPLEICDPVPVASDLEAIMASLRACQNIGDDDQEHKPLVKPDETKRTLDLLEFSSCVLSESGDIIMPVMNGETDKHSIPGQDANLDPNPSSDKERLEIAKTPLAGKVDINGASDVAVPSTPDARRKRPKMDSQSLLKSFDTEDLNPPSPVGSFLDQISQSNLAELNSLKAELECILKKSQPN